MTRRRHPQQKRPYRAVAHEWQVEEAKANPAYAQIVMFGGQGNDVVQPHMSPKNYKTYFQEGYRSNDTIYKCVQYITTNGAAIPPILYTDDTKQKKITSHPLLDKLNKPNPEQSGVTYRRAIIGYYLVAGNSFQYAIRKGIVGPPDELWALEPQKVKILPSRIRGIVGYNYDDFENTNPPQNPIPAANIAHLKTWSPDDPLWGLSPVEVGAITVDMQSAAKKWNLGLLQNGGKMTGAFTTPIILSPNDRQKVEDKINEKYAGPRNAGRIAVMDGGLQWQQMSVPPAQMDWLPGIQYNAGSLANLYNMPPQLIGDTSSTTYDNMEQAKAASYTEEIFPILDELYALWNVWLLPMYPDLKNAYLYYDKESVEVVQSVIQQQKTALAQRANQAWMQGSCTLNEAREMQDLPPIPGGDVFRFGAILVRSSEIDEYAEQSLAKPAEPPLPVPENELNLPTLAPAPTAPKPEETEPPPQGKKSMDANGIYQPDDLEAQLASLRAQGVTHVMWLANSSSCPLCLENDGVSVELGQPFPSGHILPQAHPRCDCRILPAAFSKPKSLEDVRERKHKRQAYREFMEATL